MFIVKIKGTDNEKIEAIVTCSILGLGLVILICQWAIFGFSLWGTLYTIAMCLFPVLYDSLIEI